MIEILKSRQQICEAREELRQRGMDSSRGWRRRLFQAVYLAHYGRPVPKVDLHKSWDIRRISETVETHFPALDTAIFDMGSFNSELPLALWSAGYRNIQAADLNPRGRSIRWYGNTINFRCEDFYSPDIPATSLDVLTSVSVIEHGFDQDQLIDTCHRLLKPGGLALLTTDYHNKKIPIPSEFRVFNLPYLIFCREEIEELVSSAKKAGFELIGSEDWEQAETPIHWQGNDYTFILIGLRKMR